MIIAPNRVGNSKNCQVNSACEAAINQIITGLEPAGGCTVRVSIITATAVATAAANDHQATPRILTKSSPTSALKKWPNITFLGCENGTSGYANNTTQLAPNEPRISQYDSWLLSSATEAMAKNAPNQASSTALLLNAAGNAAWSPCSFFNRLAMIISFK